MKTNLVIFIGSVASGKTSVARTLKNIIVNKGFTAKYVNININHGFAYIVTRLLNDLLRYTYVGNHYLTIRFNNKVLFCKYLGIMLLLDIIYMPVKYVTSFKVYIMSSKFMGLRHVILLDEYYLNAIVDYLYFSQGLCKEGYEQNSYIKNLYRVFYAIAYHLLLRTIRSGETLIVYMDRLPSHSISGWFCREKTKVVDVNHVIFRRVATRVILRTLKQQNNTNVSVKEHFVQDFHETLRNIVHEVLTFIGEAF
ncbi:MAG: hypothetical protein QXR17_07645 [Candidatus Bathyarchaeia archaeon]